MGFFFKLAQIVSPRELILLYNLVEAGVRRRYVFSHIVPLDSAQKIISLFDHVDFSHITEKVLMILG